MDTTVVPVLDVDSAARHLGIASSTLAKLRLSGAGPIYLKLGRRVVYRIGDLNLWLDQHARRSTSERPE